MTTLQILHASDLEGGVDAIVNAPNFAAVVDALETDAAESGISSILLSAGDNYIPGPFFNAAGDSDTFNPLFEGFYNEFFGLIDVDALDEADDTDGNGYFDNSEIQAVIEDASRDVAFEDVYVLDVNGDGVADYFEEIDNFEGRVDISIMNILGFDASAVGNHEFDAGTDSFENTINYDSEEGNSLSSGRYGTVNFLQEVDWPGVQFPYLTANLDFSEDFDVGPLFTSEILPNTDFESDLTSARVDLDNPAETGSDSNDSKIAPATLIERDGEQIGVVGATTQLIASISSTGNIDDVSSPGTNDMAALAAVLQPVVDDLIAAGSNKIILVSHLQQFALEQELATLLDGVDVIIAGGSDTILADETDVLRTEDQGGDFLDYPFLTTDLSGNPVAVVSTDGEYSYVGRLVLEFDDDGVLIPESIDSAVSGAFATDEAGVIAATGAATVEEAIAGSDKATDVQLLVDAASGVVTELDSDIAGNTEIFIEGRRQFVRTEQTTLGDLTADANLAAAQDVDETITVSLKNGGGIRAAIGETDADGNLLPTQENPVSGKEEGEISRLDIQNSLRFDNGLTALTVTSEGLKIILEHAVSASAPGATPGQFPQVGGINFSFDPNGTAQELDDDGNVVVEGTRVQSIVLLDEDGNPATTIAQNGEVFDSAPTAIRLVTLDFLVGDEGDLTGGDGYPFRALGENVVDLEISEQDALFDFLTANNATADEAFDTPELSTSLDGRIQQLDDRSDAAGAPTPTGELSVSIAQVFQGESDPEDEDSPEGASEVVSFSDGSLFVTNGNLGRIDIFDLGEPVMLEAVADGIVIEPLLTIGETLPDTSGALNATTAGDYTPVGILDGLGAYELNETTVRVFANHELLNFRGTPYEVSDGQGGTFEMLGARVSYFDIDKETMEITDGGIAYNTIVDANGNVASDTSFLPESFATNFGGAPGDGVELSGFSRFCSSVLVEAGQFEGRGLADRIYFAGEEDGGGFSSVGGAEWALDVATGIFYQVPAMGRGAWENVTELDTGTETHVAFILADDSSPFNADDFGAEEGGDDEVEAAPLFLYVGEKDTAEDAGFLARNGLEGGTLYVWVADAEGVDSPLEFNGAGNSEGGAFVAIDNSPNPDLASQDGSTGYDEYGYPTQRTLWQRAEDVGAFGFSRPEDVAFNPEDGSEFVLASTGVDTFDVDPATGNGADTFGTMYTMDVDFSDLENPTGTLEILYDGDEDATRALRSPDNLDWGDDGLIYVQEDEAEEDSLTGEPLFGEGAANPNEAGIVTIDPATGEVVRIANINRNVVLDPTSSDGLGVDGDAGDAGEWESSGILDVSELFGLQGGSLLLADVQAHGIEDQDNFDPDSRIVDGDLREGGQLVMISREEVTTQEVGRSIDLTGFDGFDGVQSVAAGGGVIVAVFDVEPNEDGSPNNGGAAVYDSETLELLATIETGNLPDSVSISPDGSVAVIANEGEFNSESDLTVDAPGGVTIIDLSDTANITASTVDFSGATDLIEAADLRLHPDADPANDVEPEFVAFSGDSATAYITLQENNGIAVLDLESQTFTDILSMGTLDHSQPGNGFDATDDDVIDIEPRNTLGLRQADAIVTADIDGTTYLLTANEGDGRGDGIDGDGNAVPFGDEARVGDLAEAGLLDPEAFPTTVVGENLEMSEAQEVTETPVPDTAATGSFTATFDEVAMTVTVSGTYSDLTSELFNVGGDDQFGNPESAIHVHLGDAGTNGPIFGNLTVTDNGDLSGSFTGTFDVTEEQAETFRNDGYYVNLHTANFNSGELRGQIDLPDVTTLGDQDLDRLIVSTIDGDTDGDGDIDVLYSFGSRSFTIFDTAGNVVFDSGDEFEQIVASIAPERFNNDDGDTVGTLDGDGDLIVQNRSDAKGPEPEAIEVGQIGDQTYAFIGLERDSGVMIYNITNPSNARFVDYIDGFGTGNVGPEVIEFIPQAESTSGNAQIAVAYEISGTTAVYDLEFNGLPVTAPAEVIDVTLLYDAALDRTADNEGLNFWIDAVQDGLPIEEAAEFFIESDEFQENFDSSTDEALVTTLYQNVLERDPEPEGFEFWTGVIDEIGQAEALLFFSRSVENVDGTDLTTLVETEPGEWAFFA